MSLDSISNIPLGSKLFKAILLYLSLKGTMQLAIVATLAALVLFAFSVVTDAVMELCQHLYEVWTHASGVERLCILLLAILFLQKVAPLAQKALAWKVVG